MNRRLRAFKAFAPAVLSGIGTLPGTLHDRSVHIWTQANNRRPINEAWLGRRLRPFGIDSHNLRMEGGRFKGYTASDFADAFSRFLPDDRGPAANLRAY